jgi:hypothetical protein
MPSECELQKIVLQGGEDEWNAWERNIYMKGRNLL